MDASVCLDLHYLRREVLAARRRGRVIVEFTDGDEVENDNEARVLADEMIALVNLPTLGPHWFAADKARATDIIVHVLQKDLESLDDTVPEPWARDLASRLVELFGAKARYLTNVRPSMDLEKSPHQWASGHTQAELDAGVALISNQLLSLFWVEDRP